MVPDHITWLDRVLVEYADAIADLCLHDNLNIATDSGLVPSDSNIDYRPHAHQLETNTSNNAGNPTTSQRKATDENTGSGAPMRSTSGSQMPIPSPGGVASVGCRANKDSKERKETMAAEGILHQNAAIIQ